jgi:RNA polymerase sigma-70 factor (ECF subfamily)
MQGPPPPANAADRDFARYRSTQDPEALGRVFDATAGKLLLVAVHLVRDAAAAEDVLQATFLAAMRNAAQYDPERPVLPWLTGILARQAALVRREGTRSPDPQRVAAGAPVADPADLAAANESAAAIAQALDGMPQPYRQVLVLALVHHLRGVEIARALDRPPETVRSQLHRGLELLRKALPRGLAVPALALAATGALAGRGLAAVRATVHAQALAARAAALTAAAAPPSALAWLAASFGGVLVQKSVLAVVAALAAAVLLWTIWPAPDAGRPPRAPVDRVDAASAAAGGATANRDAPAPAAPERSEVADAAARPRLRVRVVDARTQQPVAAAEVRSVLDADGQELPAAERDDFDALQQRDAEAHARRFGQLWRTAADGTVLVPQPRGWRAVFAARAGDRYGQAQFQRDGAPELRIALEDDRTLRVRVVGPDDAPQPDVAMVLALQWPDLPQPELLRLGTTDGAGQVTMTHLQVPVADSQRLHRAAPVTRVLPHVPGLVHAGVPIDLAAPPREPVVVAIPATGRIAVELVDERDAPAGECEFASLREARGTAPVGPEQVLTDSFFSGNNFATRDERGRIVFPRIGLGARFIVTPYVAPEREGPGPTQPDEEVVFRFRGEDAPVLRGRALDATGAPLCRQYLQIALALPDQIRWEGLRTDRDGVFWLRLRLDPRHTGAPVHDVQIERLDQARHRGVMARIALEWQHPAGTRDLGDVVLAEGPLLAAGTIVDDEGAFVQPTLEVRAAGAGATPADPAALPPSVRIVGDHFAIRGWMKAPKLELLATGRNYLPLPPLAFDRGADDLRLVLRRKGELVVTVLHDLPYEQANLLRAEVVADGDGRTVRTNSSSGPSSSTQMCMHVDELAAGRYTLQVRIAGEPEPLAVVAGLEVGAGPVQDPRLSAIDLRGRLHLARVQVADAAGAPIQGEGTLLIDDRAGGIRWVKLHDGAFSVPIATHPIAATVRVEGRREQRMPRIEGDCTVQLAPRAELRVRLAAELALPDGVTLHAFARPRSAPVNPFWQAVAQTRGPIVGSGDPPTSQPGPGQYVFALAQTGAIELTFVLARQTPDRSVALPATPAVVEMNADAGVQEVVCTAGAADVQAALRELLRE